MNTATEAAGSPRADRPNPTAESAAADIAGSAAGDTANAAGETASTVTSTAQSAARSAGFGARFVAAVSIGSVLNPVNSSIISIALVAIGRTFGVGSGSTVWLVSALYLATAIGQPTMGRLADRLGPRRIYVAGAGLVIGGGLLGWAAPSFGVLVGARVVIGLGTSAAYPAAMALVRRRSARLGVATPGPVLGALAVAGQVTMAVGPTLGGLLIGLGGWRLTFLVNVPLGLLSIVAALLWVPADEPVDRRTSVWHALDLPGVGLFAAALGALLVFLMDLTHPRRPLLALVVAFLAALTWWERRADVPFVDVRMLVRERALLATYLRYGTAMLVTYCFLYGWAIWLEQATGRSPAATGLLMTPGFAAATAVSLWTARRSRVRPLLVAGAATLTAGSAGLLVLRTDTPTWALLVISVVFGLQNGLNVTTNQTALYQQTPADRTGVAAGLMRSFMYVGAIGSAGLIDLVFPHRATDTGLHHLATVLTIGSALLLVATLTGRDRKHD